MMCGVRGEQLPSCCSLQAVDGHCTESKSKCIHCMTVLHDLWLMKYGKCTDQRHLGFMADEEGNPWQDESTRGNLRRSTRGNRNQPTPRGGRGFARVIVLEWMDRRERERKAGRRWRGQRRQCFYFGSSGAGEAAAAAPAEEGSDEKGVVGVVGGGGGRGENGKTLFFFFLLILFRFPFLDTELRRLLAGGPRPRRRRGRGRRRGADSGPGGRRRSRGRRERGTPKSVLSSSSFVPAALSFSVEAPRLAVRLSPWRRGETEGRAVSRSAEAPSDCPRERRRRLRARRGAARREQLPGPAAASPSEEGGVDRERRRRRRKGRRRWRRRWRRRRERRRSRDGDDDDEEKVKKNPLLFFLQAQ